MAIVTFLDNGDITGVYTGFVDITQLAAFIEIEDELAAKILKESYAYRVENEKVVHTPPEVVRHSKRFNDAVLVSGVVIEGVCYAITPTAMAYLAASLATSNPRALVHEKDKDTVASIDRELAEAIIEAAFDFIGDALVK